VLLGVRNTPKKEEKRGNPVTVTEDLYVLCRYYQTLRLLRMRMKEDERGKRRKQGER